jgi:8-amino-7-oxononanoate synthase
MILRDRIAQRIAALESAGLLRRLNTPAGIDLSSNDYLGLSQHPLIKERMAQAVLCEGCGSTGSRLLRGERASLSTIERRFARFKGTEAALYFASGYMANLAVLSTFPEAGDVVYSDALNHASLIDGMRLGRARKVVFPHCHAPQPEAGDGQAFLVTESVFSMDGDFAPLKEYARAPWALIVDEAHAVGIFGERGSGLSDAFITVNPMGKAFGAAGAFVCGPAWAIDYMIQRARPFIFSTAPPPAMAAALDAALDVVEDGDEIRDRLLHLARFVRGLLADAGFDVAREGSQIVPLVIGDNFEAARVAGSLQNAGFDVRAIRPPTVPEGTARLRISVNANLTEEILRRFTSALKNAVSRKSAA